MGKGNLVSLPFITHSWVITQTGGGFVQIHLGWTRDGADCGSCNDQQGKGSSCSRFSFSLSSAGIGRTGTIIVIDILVDIIHRQGTAPCAPRGFHCLPDPVLLGDNPALVQAAGPRSPSSGFYSF